MDEIPLIDRLIKGFKVGIVRVIGVGIAGVVVAGNVPYGAYWRVGVFLGIVAVYWVIVWLLQLAWLRYCRSPNSN
jgi:hypothetical protein